MPGLLQQPCQLIATTLCKHALSDACTGAPAHKISKFTSPVFYEAQSFPPSLYGRPVAGTYARVLGGVSKLGYEEMLSAKCQ